MVGGTRLVDFRTHSGFVQQIQGDLLQNARPYASQHIVCTLALHNDVVDARLVQQSPQQQARGACAHDGNLGSKGACHGCVAH